MHQTPLSTSDPAPREFQMRSLIISAFLPTLLFGIGQGAVLPVTPLFAQDLGAGTATIGLILALRGIGTMVFDIPAGMLVSRFGERWTLIGGTVVLMLVAVGAALCRAPWQFGVVSFAMGSSWSVFLLARLSYVSELAPTNQRGRALSILGGTNRAGNFIGPVLGGYAASMFGLHSAFYVQAVLSAAAALLMFVVVRDAGGAAALHGSGVLQRLTGVIRDHRKVFATAGLGAVMIHVLRNARQIVLPLWGDSIGLDPTGIGFIFSISSSIDMLLFYPAGVVMDRWGRKWVAVPSLAVLSLGMAAVPLATGFWSLGLVGLLLGFGNGLGSGIVMTLGADFSPASGRGEFLGVWRLLADAGGAAGPLMFGSIAAAASLGVASVATAGLGLFAAGVLMFIMPETLQRDRHRRDSP